MNPKDNCTILLDESVASLFAGRPILSAFDDVNGFTLIFAGIPKVKSADEEKAVAAPVEGLPSDLQAPTDGTYQNPEYSGLDELGGDDTIHDDGSPKENYLESLVNVHCSQTIKNVLSMDELKNLVFLIRDVIQPQAVNLLKEGFPSFKKAVGNNELGKEISLYIYYEKGDADGIQEHESAPGGALAYVAGYRRLLQRSL